VARTTEEFLTFKESVLILPTLGKNVINSLKEYWKNGYFIRSQDMFGLELTKKALEDPQILIKFEQALI